MPLKHWVLWDSDGCFCEQKQADPPKVTRRSNDNR